MMVDVALAFSIIATTIIMFISFTGLVCEKVDLMLRARMGMTFKISSFILVTFIVFNALFK